MFSHSLKTHMDHPFIFQTYVFNRANVKTINKTLKIFHIMCIVPCHRIVLAIADIVVAIAATESILAVVQLPIAPVCIH